MDTCMHHNEYPVSIAVKSHQNTNTSIQKEKERIYHFLTCTLYPSCNHHSSSSPGTCKKKTPQTPYPDLELFILTPTIASTALHSPTAAQSDAPPSSHYSSTHRP